MLHIKLHYSQTWVNDHLRMTTTCLQRPLFWAPDFNFYNIKLPLNNDHLSTTATNFGTRGWSLYTGLTVFKCQDCWSQNSRPHFPFSPWGIFIFYSHCRCCWCNWNLMRTNETKFSPQFDLNPNWWHKSLEEFWKIGFLI